MKFKESYIKNVIKEESENILSEALEVPQEPEVKDLGDKYEVIIPLNPISTRLGLNQRSMNEEQYFDTAVEALSKFLKQPSYFYSFNNVFKNNMIIYKIPKMSGDIKNVVSRAEIATKNPSSPRATVNQNKILIGDSVRRKAAPEKIYKVVAIKGDIHFIQSQDGSYGRITSNALEKIPQIKETLSLSHLKNIIREEILNEMKVRFSGQLDEEEITMDTEIEPPRRRTFIPPEPKTDPYEFTGASPTVMKGDVMGIKDAVPKGSRVPVSPLPGKQSGNVNVTGKYSGMTDPFRSRGTQIQTVSSPSVPKKVIPISPKPQPQVRELPTPVVAPLPNIPYEDERAMRQKLKTMSDEEKLQYIKNNYPSVASTIKNDFMSTIGTASSNKISR